MIFWSSSKGLDEVRSCPRPGTWVTFDQVWSNVIRSQVPRTWWIKIHLFLDQTSSPKNEPKFITIHSRPLFPTFFRFGVKHRSMNPVLLSAWTCSAVERRWLIWHISINMPYQLFSIVRLSPPQSIPIGCLAPLRINLPHIQNT